MNDSPPPSFRETGRRTLAKAKFLELHAIDWQGPDGQTRTWESAERVGSPGAVVVIARFRDSDDYLLIRQYRPPARCRVWEFPAGLLEPGEDPSAAALRELREETGYTGTITALLPAAVFTSPGLGSESVFVAFVTIDPDAPENRDAVPTPDPGEFVEVFRLSAADVPARMGVAAREGDGCDSKVAVFFTGLTVWRHGAEARSAGGSSGTLAGGRGGAVSPHMVGG